MGFTVIDVNRVDLLNVTYLTTQTFFIDSIKRVT